MEISSLYNLTNEEHPAVGCFKETLKAISASDFSNEYKKILDQYCINDWKSDDNQVHSVMCLPLFDFREKKVLGVLSFQTTKKNIFKDDYNIYNRAFREVKKYLIENLHQKLEKRKIYFLRTIEMDSDLSYKANAIRKYFRSEYCAIGKIVDDAMVEDLGVGFDMHYDAQKQKIQKDNIKRVQKALLTNNSFLLCQTLNNTEEKIKRFEEEQISTSQNSHSNIYTEFILKSKKISNTTIIPIRGSNKENYGYIQLINSKKEILYDEFVPFNNALLNQLQLERKQQELKKNENFDNDSKFLKKIITEMDNVDNLLKEIIAHLYKEFKADIVSFRIPILNGFEEEPLFYLKDSSFNTNITDDEIKNDYNNRKQIKNKYELAGYKKLRCWKKVEILFENEKKYLNAGLQEEVIIMPVYENIKNDECLQGYETCTLDAYPMSECVARFKILYGIFNIKVLKKINVQEDPAITKFESDRLKEEIQNRLLYLSGQITLVLNSIIVKCENDSSKIFRRNIKEKKFMKIKDFDQQIVNLIKEVVHTKECSIYKYRKREERDYPEVLYLSATTAEKIALKGKSYSKNEIISKVAYSISAKKNAIVRVYDEKKSTYFHRLLNENYGDYVEMIDGTNISAIEEPCFFVPIIVRKREQEICTGVIVLIGKKSNKDRNISEVFWEQDRNLIEFIMEMFIRISEADNERMTFLSQLNHELSRPITLMVNDDELFINTYTRNKGAFTKKEAFDQITKNRDNSLLFKYIMSDIEQIYSSSKEDIKLNIQIQPRPWEILLDAVQLFEKEAQIVDGIIIEQHVSLMPPIKMDKHRITQVFINMLKNAIRYSYPGQPVEIYYNQTEDKQHEIRFVNYGIGIFKEDAERIFELYERGENAAERRPSGSGMGLYIVNEIMKAHRGKCVIRKLGPPTSLSTEISLIFPNN